MSIMENEKEFGSYTAKKNWYVVINDNHQFGWVNGTYILTTWQSINSDDYRPCFSQWLLDMDAIRDKPIFALVRSE